MMNYNFRLPVPPPTLPLSPKHSSKVTHFLHKSFGSSRTILSCEKFKQYRAFHQTKPFSLISREHYDLIAHGMIYLPTYITPKEQVEIVNICHEYGIGPGGFYQPGHTGGVKRRLQMMCFGRNWDPQTKYEKRYRSCDGSEAPPIPDKLISLVKARLQDARPLLNREKIPSMYPDIFIVNFYTTTGRHGLHQDCDESSDSLKKGSPVVVISIGDIPEFVYGYSEYVKGHHMASLQSGDVVIFGGKARNIFHGVRKINPDSAPFELLKESMIRPGCLTLAFKQF